MRGKRLLLQLGLVAGLAGLAACGSGTGSDNGVLPSTNTSPMPISIPEGLASIERMLEVPHAGVRRIEVTDQSVDPPRFLAFRERVMTDGNGHYSLEPTEAITPVAPDWTQFSLLQRIREGYLFQHRDFAIRDLGLFQKNYVLIDLDRSIQVAGRDCARYRIEHRTPSPDSKRYEVAIDVTTGIVMRYEAFDAQGRALVAMEYEIYDETPDLSGFVPHEDISPPRELDWTWDLPVQIHQPVQTPRVLPEGFALRRAVTLKDGADRDWLRLTYTDGVESLFFLTRIDNPFALANPITPIAPDSVQVSAVAVFQMGSATAAQGTFDGREFIAVGKLPEAELLDMIESALP